MCITRVVVVVVGIYVYRNILMGYICKYLKKVEIMAMSSDFEPEAKNSAEAVRVVLTTVATACYFAIVTLFCFAAEESVVHIHSNYQPLAVCL